MGSPRCPETQKSYGVVKELRDISRSFEHIGLRPIQWQGSRRLFDNLRGRLPAMVGNTTCAYACSCVLFSAPDCKALPTQIHHLRESSNLPAGC